MPGGALVAAVRGSVDTWEVWLWLMLQTAKKSRAVLLDWESHAVLNVVNLRMSVPHLKCNIMIRKHSHDVG